MKTVIVIINKKKTLNLYLLLSYFKTGASLSYVTGVAQIIVDNKKCRKCYYEYFNEWKVQFLKVNNVSINAKAIAK